MCSLRKFFKGHFSVVCWGTQLKLTGARFLQKGAVGTQVNGRLAHLERHQNGCRAFLTGITGEMQPSPLQVTHLNKCLNNLKELLVTLKILSRFQGDSSSKMSSKTASTNNIAQARRTVQQLRLEASIERIKVRAKGLAVCSAQLPTLPEQEHEAEKIQPCAACFPLLLEQ